MAAPVVKLACVFALAVMSTAAAAASTPASTPSQNDSLAMAAPAEAAATPADDICRIQDRYYNQQSHCGVDWWWKH